MGRWTPSVNGAFQGLWKVCINHASLRFLQGHYIHLDPTRGAPAICNLPSIII